MPVTHLSRFRRQGRVRENSAFLQSRIRLLGLNFALPGVRPCDEDDQSALVYEILKVFESNRPIGSSLPESPSRPDRRQFVSRLRIIRPIRRQSILPT